jgi:hypothetical protein
MFEKNVGLNFLSFALEVTGYRSSLIGHFILPRAYVTLICCRTFIRWHTHF